jgi:lipoprotein-releasing system permease protein
VNTEYFIARRMLSKGEARFSRPIVVISVISIALSLAVMFMSIVILTGFQKAIRDKVIGFGGHIQVTHFDQTQSLEPIPIPMKPGMLDTLRRIPGIVHLQGYATKAGIIRANGEIQGVVLKGIGPDYDWSFFTGKMVDGDVFAVPDTGKTDRVIVSKTIANMMMLKTGDDLRMYFVSGSDILGRKFRISGIYDSGMEDFDKMFVLGDIRHIQKINGWEPDQVGGIEILIGDFDRLDQIGGEVYHSIGFSLDASTIRQLYPQIFDWLDLQDMNVVIILALMVLVSAITMISMLLILILERTRMIGTLKALGMRNRGIRKIFLYNSLYITGTGILFGNLIGFALSLLQLKFGFLTLPVESYYVSTVPIRLNLWHILILNGGTILICYLVLIIPSMIITRVSPVRAIRFN